MSENPQNIQNPQNLQTYIAHYVSPANENPRKGFFEFESGHRASSRSNTRDARIKMLEIYGKEAVSWEIDEIRLKRKSDGVKSMQLELDFRPPKKAKKRRPRK